MYRASYTDYYPDQQIQNNIYINNIYIQTKFIYINNILYVVSTPCTSATASSSGSLILLFF